MIYEQLLSGMRVEYVDAASASLGTGLARNYNDDGYVRLNNTISASLAKAGAGGLDTGTEAASTKYALHAVSKDKDTSTGSNDSVVASKLVDSTADFTADGVNVGDVVPNVTDGTQAKVNSIESVTTLVLDTHIFTATSKSYVVGPVGIAMFSLSETAPTLPTGYTGFKKILWVKNDASSNALKFNQVGGGNSRWVCYDTDRVNVRVLDAQSDTTWTVIDLSPYMSESSNYAKVLISFNPYVAASYIALRPNGSTLTETQTPYIAGSGGTNAFYDYIEMPTDSAQKMEFKCDHASDVASIYVAAYLEDM